MKMIGNDLVFYVQLQVKPEHLQEWKNAVIDVIDRMAAEPAFVACYMHQDTQNANCFTLYERWREPSLEAFIKNQFEGRAFYTVNIACLNNISDVELANLPVRYFDGRNDNWELSPAETSHL